MLSSESEEKTDIRARLDLLEVQVINNRPNTFVKADNDRTKNCV